MHLMRVLLPFALGFLALACGSKPDAASAQPEQARSAQTVAVTTSDGETVELLLVGVRGPDPDTATDASHAARRALDSHIASQTLRYEPAGETDRYDRVPARVRLEGRGDLALDMVEAGWLMVWPRLGQDADFDGLHEAERRARQAGAGLWSGGEWGAAAFAVRDTDPDRLAQYLDSAQIIEGRVISTGAARDGRVFLNFGLDWRTDFTAVADEGAAQRFVEAGTDLRTLEGAVTRVRGWLFELNGPAITLSHPAQVELVDAPAARGRPR